jgi:hypothetical protein
LLAKTILSQPRPKTFPIQKSELVCAVEPNSRLHHFAANPRVHLPFHLLNIDPTFLSKDPTEWNHDGQFIKLKTFINRMKVTNDSAERACQLATTFNNKLTKDESQRQALFHTVVRQRHQRPDLSRKALGKK